MKDRDRLAQLQGLVSKLERMPASAERDWMLNEVRARAVDVETGVKPSALRALPQNDVEAAPVAPEPVPAPAPAPARARQARLTPRVPRPAPVVTQWSIPAPAPVDPANAVNLLEEGFVLSLDDSPPATDETTLRPWSYGLRG